MAADTAIVRTFAQYYVGGVTTFTPSMVNYAPPDWALPSPAQAETRRVSVPLTGVTISLTGWTTILAILLNNRDPTNYVEVAYTYPSPTGGAKANVTSVLAGAPIVISGPVTVASNLVMTAFGAAVTVEYAIIGT